MKPNNIAPTRKPLSPLRAVLICSLMTSNALANTTGTSIGLKFASTDPNFATSGLGVGDSAGVVPSANWNNLTNASGSSSAIVADSSGTSVASPVSVTWSAPNTFRSGANNAFPAGPNRNLMSGYLDSGNTTATGVFVAVSNLPPAITLAGYDVYVYFLGDSGADRGGAYTITNQAGFTRKYGSTMATPSSFTQDPGTDSNNSLDGNYLRFANLSGDWFTLKTDTTLTSPNGFRAPVNAIEIVGLPCATVAIATQPTGVTTCPGSAAVFSVSGVGSLPTYQWRKNGAPLANGPTGNGSTISGATSATLTISAVAAADGADASSGYDCVITVPCDGSSTSSTRVALTVKPSASVFSVTGGGSDCSGAGVAVGLNGSETGMNYRLLRNGTFGGTLRAGTGSVLSFGSQLTSGTYTVQASNTVSGCTQLMGGSATVSIIPPTAITGGPTPGAATNYEGGAVSFSVTASGSGLSYQWQRDGVNLVQSSKWQGANSSSLTISALSLADTAVAGHGYRCVVSGSCGSPAVSGEAVLTVLHKASLPEPVVSVWTNRYAFLGLADDQAARMVMDTNGNVIVAGYLTDSVSGKDFLTIKYSNTGTPLWTNRYDGPGKRDDAAQGLAVDVSGNVIVTGYSHNGTNDDFYTAKYAAADGTILWEKRYDGIGNSSDQSVAVAADSSGNAIVTGQSAGTNCVVKYAAADGAVLWVQRTNGPGNTSFQSVAIAVDTNGDAIATGQAWNGSTYDFFTAKYSSSDGAILWTKQYDALGKDDGAASLALDASGNAVVAGRSVASGSQYDFYLAKYAAADGALLWSRRYYDSSSTSRKDQATAIAVDASGNVVVTGYVTDSGGRGNFYTVKHAASDGATVWWKRFSGSPDLFDAAYAIATDGAGNVIVTGMSQNASNSDYYTIKYGAADGTVLWQQRYNGPANGEDIPVAVAVDSNGDAVVAGTSAKDFHVAKYASADGALAWENRYDGPDRKTDIAKCVAVDANGNVVVTGRSSLPDHFLTVKYSPNGALIWERRYSSTNDPTGEPAALALDGSGNVVVAGSSANGSSWDYYTAKYAAADGSLLWEKRYNGPANSDDLATAVTVDANGNVIVTGGSVGSGTGSDYYTAKYAAADGSLLWEKRYSGPGSQPERAIGVCVDTNGNVVVTGDSSSAAYYYDIYTAKYAAADGALLWEKRYNHPTNNDDRAIALALDVVGNVVVTGYSYLGGNYDGYTAKYAAADGALQWEARYDSGGGDVPSALALDGSGNAVVTGMGSRVFKYAAGNGALLWTQPLATGLSGDSVAIDANGDVVVGANNNSDLNTFKYAGATGTLIWSAHYNGPVNGDDRTYSKYSLAIGPNGEVVVTGGSDGSTNYAGTRLNKDFLTIKYVTLGFAPFPTSVVVGSNVNFAPYGGQGPYVYAIATNHSGGTIDPNTGVYTAGNTCGVTDAIRLTDSNNLSTVTFVRVVGTSPPSIVCPGNIVVQAGRECGTNVTFSITATDSCGLPLTPILSPTSGSQFPVGTTTVNCTAMDDLGRTASCSFTVAVQLVAPACAPTPPGLVGFWRGEYNAMDSVGINHGSLVLSATYNPCSIGGAGFSLFNSYVEVPVSPTTQQTNLTVEAWVYRYSNPPSQAGILGTWNDLGGAGTAWRRTYMMWTYNGKLEFLCGSGTNYDRATDTLNLPTNAWVHVAGSYDGSMIRLFRDGVEVASKAFSGILNTNDRPFTIGLTASGGDGPDYWNGMIDDVSVYSRALSSNEIAAIYAAGSAGKCLVTANNPPTLANPIPDTNGVYGAPLSFTFAANTFSDPDAGQTLSYSASALPPGIVFMPGTRAFAGTPTMVGTNSVTVTATDNGSPALSTNDVFDIVIAKAPLTATADNNSRPYGQANPPLTFSYSGFVLGESESVLDTPPLAGTTATTASPVGPYPITLSGGADGHYSFNYVNGTLNITPAPLTVTANNANRVYGATNPPLSGSIVGLVSGDNITVTFATTATIDSPPGAYSITPILSDPDGKLVNYAVTTNNGTLTVIGLAELHVEMPPGTNLATDTAIYFGSMMSRYVDPTSQTQAPDNTFTVTFTGILPSAYAAYQIQYADNPFGPWSQLPVSGLAPDAGGTIQFHDLTPRVVAYYRLLVLTDTHRVFTIRNTGTNDLSGITVTVTSTNAANFELDLTGTATVLSPGASTTFTVTYVAFDTNARTAALSINGNVPSPFALTLIGGDVPPPNRAPVLSNPITDTNGVYGAPFSFAFAADTFSDPDAGQTLTYSAIGLPPGIVFTPGTRAFAGTPTAVGTNSVTVTATDNGSPALSTNDAFEIAIAKAPLTVAANNATRAYGAPNPIFSGSLLGVVNGDNLTAVFSTPADSTSPPGNYPITPALQDPDNRLANYAVTTNAGILTVEGVTLEFTLSAGSPELCWPSNAVAFVLECTDSLTPPINWQRITNGIFANGVNLCYRATNAIPSARFYRLHLP